MFHIYHIFFQTFQNHLEPMVVDPVNEENDNQEEEAVIVENSNLVCIRITLMSR
jgi:hypothetical protein